MLKLGKKTVLISSKRSQVCLTLCLFEITYEQTSFSLLRQECPPILTSGEMLSHPGGWDKPIPEVIHLWRHRTSKLNNLEKSRLVCVLDIFCTFLGKNEKNNQSPHWGRDSGIPSSCPRFATSTTRQASSCIAKLGHSGFPRPSLNVVLDSIILSNNLKIQV